MSAAQARQRTISWSDPQIAARQVLQVSGLKFLQRIVSGEIPPPPISALTGMSLQRVEEGLAVFVLEPDESHYNPIGSVHGGIIATACDSAASCAVQTLLPEGRAYTTLEMKVNYVRPVTTRTGTLRCVGEAIHVSRRIGTAAARLEDESGKLYAHATVTCMIFQTESAS